MKIEALERLANAPMELPVGGSMIACTKLRPVDIAEAVGYVRSRRAKKYLEAVPVNEIMRPLIADSMAKIWTTPITLFDVLDDWDGKIKLCQLSVNRAGGKYTIEQLAVQLGEVDANEFFGLLCRISGLLPDRIAETPDPLGIRGQTMPAEYSIPSIGDNGSLTCATSMG